MDELKFTYSDSVATSKLMKILAFSDRSENKYRRRLRIREYSKRVTSPYFGSIMLPEQATKLLCASDFETIPEHKYDMTALLIASYHNPNEQFKYQYVGTYFLANAQHGVNNSNIRVEQSKQAYINVHKNILELIKRDNTLSGCYVIIDNINDRMFHKWRFSQSYHSKINDRFRKWEDANARFTKHNCIADLITESYGCPDSVRYTVKHGTGSIFLLTRNEAKSLLKFTIQNLSLPAGCVNTKIRELLTAYIIEDRLSEIISTPLHGRPTYLFSKLMEYMYYKLGCLKFSADIEIDETTGERKYNLVYRQVIDKNTIQPENTTFTHQDGNWTLSLLGKRWLEKRENTRDRHRTHTASSSKTN